MAVVLERSEIGQAFGQRQSAFDAASWLFVALTARAEWPSEAAIIASRQITADLPDDLFVRIRFGQLVREWKRDTRYSSSMAKIILHPAYQAIIGMGRKALPLILAEFHKHGGHWFWALHAITQENPAPQDADYSMAAQAWLDWGKVRGYL